MQTELAYTKTNQIDHLPFKSKYCTNHRRYPLEASNAVHLLVYPVFVVCMSARD